MFESELFSLRHWIGSKDVTGRAYALPMGVPVNTLIRMGMRYVDKTTGLTYVAIMLDFFGTNPPRYEPDQPPEDMP